MGMESFGAAWLTLPNEEFSSNFLFSTKGLQYLQIYLWICVDIAWMQGFLYMGDFFGIALVFCSWILFLRTATSGSYDDSFICFTQFLWLCGNMWWMSGEVHDIRYPKEDELYDLRAYQASYTLILAFLFASVYFIIVRPSYYIRNKNSSNPQHKSVSIIDDTKIPQKMLCFPRFKDYERIHLLFWIGKDCAWCLFLGPIWIAFFLPTYFMALDYALITMNRKHLLIEHSHYLAQFLWVTANGVWAFGEIYSIHDAPMSLFSRSKERWITCRWYACWIVSLALVPVIVMYIIWIYNTITGKIEKSRELHETKASSSSSSTVTTSPIAISIPQSPEYHRKFFSSTTPSTHEVVMKSLIGHHGRMRNIDSLDDDDDIVSNDSDFSLMEHDADEFSHYHGTQFKPPHSHL